MKTRAITGFFFIVVMIGSLLFGQYVFGVFFLMLSLLCLREFYGLIKQTGINPNTQTGLMNGFVIYAIFALVLIDHSLAMHKLLFLLPLTLSAVFIQELFKKTEAPFINIACTFTGIIYICLPFTFFHALAYVKGDFNFHYPLAFLLLLWANDTGAYLVGIKFGRTKLFERHSPKKTWEGFIGGVLISAGVALIIGHYYTELKWGQWVIVAVLISFFGTIGDLIESMFKRSINVKDSGSILPGHGGLLDRFDGLLLATPLVYTYLYLITN
ncbi:MAG TPA: phosphatidate cytidylyltransferase [Mucilaginibacter sp.]|jgi:phosphatidate cytidylyltransferase|nr:phosphatidate cytidylyltransferase [Mucilaginibacter sp.]